MRHIQVKSIVSGLSNLEIILHLNIQLPELHVCLRNELFDYSSSSSPTAKSILEKNNKIWQCLCQCSWVIPFSSHAHVRACIDECTVPVSVHITCTHWFVEHVTILETTSVLAILDSQHFSTRKKTIYIYEKKSTLNLHLKT